MKEKNIKAKVSIKESNIKYLNENNISLQYFINKAIEDIKTQDDDIYSRTFSINFNNSQRN